jgi:hypothetical protein
MDEAIEVVLFLTQPFSPLAVRVESGKDRLLMGYFLRRDEPKEQELA